MDIRQIEVKETYPVRAAVLRPGHPVEELYFPGDEHPQIIHLGAFENGNLVGIASIFPDLMDESCREPMWRLRGMGVLAEWQGKGVGRVLLETCYTILCEKKVEKFWCNARISAIPFYEKNGFSVVGGGFELPGLGEHFHMYRNIEG